MHMRLAAALLLPTSSTFLSEYSHTTAAASEENFSFCESSKGQTYCHSQNREESYCLGLLTHIRNFFLSSLIIHLWFTYCSLLAYSLLTHCSGCSIIAQSSLTHCSIVWVNFTKSSIYFTNWSIFDGNSKDAKILHFFCV